MPLLSARKAASWIGRDERTIRRWIADGRLAATRDGNLYQIDQRELARLQDTHRSSEQIRDLADLERRVSALETRLARKQTRKAAPQEELIDGDELPAGSMLASRFARQHGIGEKTARYHLLTGLSGERLAYLACRSARNPDETERWLTPDQQDQALLFWRRHGVAMIE